MSQKLTLEEVREQVAELLYEDPAELTDEENLIDWGLDSVRIMTLVEKWRRLGVQITFADLAERPTLAEWWAVLEPKLPAGE
ncbi:Aryl carrier domain-containing protein [Saccharopolyspora kobensis]|uniref:Aryl carrier domain-containing protein n=1 Tax=Saccharopolyspora kobensis TaxID=146035 RepID=A0A1H6EK31_9PSEU|nr:phosphopantetheine-binding protein [Saccharopolyspora kobensis]SEG97346.1 Aryl carrier domain-containing protein [Saccharopolyspora kobensis]SFC80618.1 bifunctional isochorismate lyase / aryl carrier protein [Saccharopolyspora kobensis]